ncbi:MAG TPA: hypothetical protein VK558_07785 [Patescibacteria group bacterium]|nr:hypothetical protein [Patescibacteria group bacterium]
MTDILTQGLGVLEQVAPTLATMIGGPLAGTAVSALEGVFGLTPTGDKAAALTAVAAATPDQLLAVKAENDRHAEAMAKMGLDTASLTFNDRDSARKREEEVKDWTPRALAFVAIGTFVAMVAYVMAGHMNMDGSAAAVFGTVIGYVSSKADLVLSYYFGSSVAADQQASAFRKQWVASK